MLLGDVLNDFAASASSSIEQSLESLQREIDDLEQERAQALQKGAT